MEPPADFGQSEAKLMREMIAERTSPFFSGARRYMGQSSRMGEGPYARAARDLLTTFPGAEQPGAAQSYCDKNRHAWSRTPTHNFDARMVSSCEAGDPSACYVASLIVENERLARDYAARACAEGLNEACANIRDEANEDETNEDETNEEEGTCETGNRAHCWSEAAAVRADSLESYTRYCFAGSGFDCFRRGLLLERDSSLRAACVEGEPFESRTTDEAREACSDGDVIACFQLGVANYVTPRELEKLPEKKSFKRPEPFEDRATVTARCIKYGDTMACASLARGFELGENAVARPVCTARMLFEACKPADTTWCEMFESLRKD
jgi:hypothetical protein